MSKKLKEGGLGDLAHAAERDHEVQMARADLYKIAKYAIKFCLLYTSPSPRDS